MNDNTSTARPPRLLMFGIDGATFDLLLPFVKEGRLPNIAGLLERGVHGPLQSTSPPNTPCAWTTMMTGTNPGRHGIYDFVLPKPHSYGRRMTTAADRKTTPVWMHASEQGKSVGVINVPTTYPPDDVNGFMLSGMMGAPAYKPDVVRPASLFAELQQAIGGFPMEPVSRTSRGYSLDALDAQIANRVAAFTYLLDNHPTDMFISVINWVDHVQHFFFGAEAIDSDGRHVDNMLAYAYEAADRMLGELLKRAGEETNVVIVSDHGAGPVTGHLNTDRLLVDCGLLRFASKKTETGEGGLLRRIARKTPQWLKDLLPKSVRRSAMEVVRREYEGEVDWTKTKVFRRNTAFGLDLNVEGRLPQGIIPQSRYEEARDEIIATLTEALEQEPGLQTVRFCKREELYCGPQVELASDLIIVPDEFAMEVTASPHPEAGTILSVADMDRFDAIKRYKIGSHRLAGIFIAAGPDIAPGQNPHNAQIADITPTLLQLAGAQVPEGLDGRVLSEILQ